MFCIQRTGGSVIEYSGWSKSFRSQPTKIAAWLWEFAVDSNNTFSSVNGFAHAIIVKVLADVLSNAIHEALHKQVLRTVFARNRV